MTEMSCLGDGKIQSLKIAHKSTDYNKETRNLN